MKILQVPLEHFHQSCSNEPKSADSGLFAAHRHIFAVNALALLLSVVSVSAVTTVSDLTCEYRTNPQGIDVPSPRLSWLIASGERDEKQIGYQVLVASSLDLLDKNQGDLWDSRKVGGDDTVNIVYAGKPLASGEQCFWKVRIWDGKGEASAWSVPASWSVGLLEPGDWQGQWIGWDHGEISNDFSGARWIWFPEGNPTESAPVAARYFRHVFELPANQTVSGAIMEITADDQFRLFVNGEGAGHAENWSTPQKVEIGKFLKAGKNVLAVEARNVGDNPNPAGLVAKVKIEFASQSHLTFITDGSWKSATNAETGWQSLTFDDAEWVGAKVLGEYGVQPWGAIGGNDRRLPARYLRREFTVEKKVRRATAYVCGLGLSELYLNGQKVGDDVLSPALSEYDKRAFYVVHDVTAQLKRGANAIGVILGNGRYFSPRAPGGMKTFGYPKLQLQMNIQYVDGTTQQVVSDGNWKLTTAGPIRANNEYDGEEYDARLEMPGWDRPKFDDSKWQRVQSVEPGAPLLTAQIGEPIRVMETIHPVAITNPRPGMYVFDLGQNIGGWCRLKVRGPAGTVVKLRHAETLAADGTLFTANLRTAKAEDAYTLKGHGVETYQPRFAHHGFRYVEVTGYPGEPALDAIEGKLVCDALPKTGDFATSNPLINQIYHNIYWTTRDNYRSMPTDLPRDERQGWLGDRQEVSKGETYLFNIAPLYAQWLTDLQDAQLPNGSISDVSPAYWPLYQDGTVWASTYIIVPQMLYRQYADAGILSQHYDSMKKWMDHMTTFLDGDIMPRNTYEDWCFPPKSAADMTSINSRDPQLTTSGVLMSTAVFYHDLRLMGQSARLLGKAQDAEHFDALADKIKVAFNRRFYNSTNGYYDNGTQTSCVLPLAFGLVPDEYKTNVFARLVENITVENDNHLRTGLIGGHYLMRVLADNGRPDLAYTIATQTTYPSWGYMISKGATTIWELWNGDTADTGMNSHNIVMLIGDLNIWLHEYLGGIRCDSGTPGFKKIIIKPEVLGDLTWVKDSYDSIHGRISSEWHRSAGEFDLRVTIPANTSAEVYLLANGFGSITESGKPAAQAQGVKFLRQEGDRVVLQVGSGNYQFVSQTR
ncbi:MAG TPA: glycoside hydrolase family 78 protein [Verrucomicrobiae bacterium]|jgi:alpha-L-rhamnosidase|nr:glycoside hydrolase family 78 protein [Verrucomicrobiae bacterium]